MKVINSTIQHVGGSVKIPIEISILTCTPFRLINEDSVNSKKTEYVGDAYSNKAVLDPTIFKYVGDIRLPNNAVYVLWYSMTDKILFYTPSLNNLVGDSEVYSIYSPLKIIGKGVGMNAVGVESYVSGYGKQFDSCHLEIGDNFGTVGSEYRVESSNLNLNHDNVGVTVNSDVYLESGSLRLQSYFTLDVNDIRLHAVIEQPTKINNTTPLRATLVKGDYKVHILIED